MNVEDLFKEIENILQDVDPNTDGETLVENYQKVAAYLMRLQEIHNQLSLLEITGRITPDLKKFRTMIVDSTIERLEKLAVFESRKLTAKKIEFDLERG